MSSSQNVSPPPSLFEHLDNTTTDCLQSFQDGVATAQKELGKEHERLQQLERSLRAARDRNSCLARDKADAERRVDALTTECARVRTLNIQLTDSIDKVDDHVSSVRGPRSAATGATKEHDAQAVLRRSEYIQASQAFVAHALQALNPNKHPKTLQACLSALQRDAVAARGRIAALRAASAGNNIRGSTTAQQQQQAHSATADDEAHPPVNDMQELASLHEADANARAEHQQAQRTLITERDALRDRVRTLTQQFETIEVQALEVQTTYNALVNEVCGTACRSCGGALWTIGGDSGHD